MYIIEILIGPLCDLKLLNGDQRKKNQKSSFLHNFRSVGTISRNDISMKSSQLDLSAYQYLKKIMIIKAIVIFCRAHDNHTGFQSCVKEKNLEELP